jgi:hypothetical protein
VFFSSSSKDEIIIFIISLFVLYSVHNGKACVFFCLFALSKLHVPVLTEQKLGRSVISITNNQIQLYSLKVFDLGRTVNTVVEINFDFKP